MTGSRRERSRPRILFVENEAEFRNHRARHLADHGYHVITAGSVAEAEQALRDELVHLAIVDIRLENDDDPKDVSGLMLARDERYRYLPKIILTGHTNFEFVRDALAPSSSGPPAAVGYVVKDEGEDAMLATVDQAFTRHVAINWNLTIRHDEAHGMTLPHLADMLDAVEGNARSVELDDLFRRLFLKHHEVRLGRLLWQRGGRVGLVVFAFGTESIPESLLAVCGSRPAVAEEARRYAEHAPKSADTATHLHAAAETAHFGGRVYVGGWSLDTASTLHELYRAGPEKSIAVVLASLTERTLGDWSRGTRVLGAATLEDNYRARFGLSRGGPALRALQKHVEALVRQAPTVGLRIERLDGTLKVWSGGRVSAYPDPLLFVAGELAVEEPPVLTTTAGWLSGENVLTDRDHRAWLTDFGEAGLAPLVWNAVTLEAAVRFDWIEGDSLAELHEFEAALTGDSFERFEAGDLAPSLRKPLRVVQAIRRLAVSAAGQDPTPYHVGILFHACHRLVEMNATARLMPSELIRGLHLLMAAAVVAKALSTREPRESAHPLLPARPVVVDKEKGTVTVDGRAIHLTRQGYELLCYFYDTPSQLRTRRDIVEHVFRQVYDESDESQMGRLSTAIRRLRERIEPDPDKPRYLLTESGRGYRLIC